MGKSETIHSERLHKTETVTFALAVFFSTCSFQEYRLYCLLLWCGTKCSSTSIQNHSTSIITWKLTLLEALTGKYPGNCHTAQ